MGKLGVWGQKCSSGIEGFSPGGPEDKAPKPTTGCETNARCTASAFHAAQFNIRECHFSGTTRADESIEQRLKRCVLGPTWDGADVTFCDRLLQTPTSPTGMARSPLVIDILERRPVVQKKSFRSCQNAKILTSVISVNVLLMSGALSCPVLSILGVYMLFIMWINRPLQISQLGQLSLSSFRGR